MTFSPGSVDQIIRRPTDDPLDRTLLVAGRRVRFTSILDADTERFEQELCRRPLCPDSQRRRAPGEPRLLSQASPALVELPLYQRHVWLQHTRREFRLLQVSDPDGLPAMQAVVYVHRPRLFPWYGNGYAQQLGPAVSGEDELFGLGLLTELCRASGDLLSLRLVPRRLLPRDLRDFEGRARLCGFSLTEPLWITRTLLYDLQQDPEEILRGMGQKLRRKLRARHKADKVEVRVLTDGRYAAACQEACRASLERTGGQSQRRDFEAMFSLAQERPDLMRVLGLFMKDRPDQLLAFACACRHGAVAEYVIAGSLDDPGLRKMPFNYWLLWDLFLWARDNGSLCMDLGGISVGGPHDPLCGTARFKRHLSDLEVEVGREMTVTFLPYERWAYSALRALQSRLRVRLSGPGRRRRALH